VHRLVVAAALLLLAGCGERIVELDPREAPDAAAGPLDGAPCVAGTTQCTNCVDDDGDGDVDGFDVECTGAIDDDEGTFQTDVNGDNMDTVNQDCFFDGNSGGGDDGCDRHVCCILGLDASACMAAGYDNNFDPAADCPGIDQACIDVCAPLVPPGCDCFGCCTICDGAVCVDIYIHPGIAPDCDLDVLSDQDLCPRCTPIAACGTGCDGGAAECATSADCGAGLFCASGCCIDVVN